MAALCSTRLFFLVHLAITGLADSFQIGGRPWPAVSQSRCSSSLSMASLVSDERKPPNRRSPPQLIQLTEPTTKTKVLLIGTMHYNPTSIQQAEKTIEELAQKGELASVVVESCDNRWNTTMELLSTPRGRLLKPVLTSEMKAAADVAIDYGRPVVLGDQLINVTGDSLGKAFRRTLLDLSTPLNGGWNRYYGDVKVAADVALPSGPGYLTPSSFLDPRLLLAAPVSFMKYPASFLARNPLSTILVSTVLFAFTWEVNALEGGSTAFSDAALGEQVLSIASSLAFAGLELLFLGRLMIEVLLAERNEVIARNILDQCQIYSKSKDKGNSWLNIFSNQFSDNKDGLCTKDIPYVPRSVVESSATSTDDRKDRVVVAVLGMAHVNGIVKLLREELVPGELEV